MFRFPLPEGVLSLSHGRMCSSFLLSLFSSLFSILPPFFCLCSHFNLHSSLLLLSVCFPSLLSFLLGTNNSLSLSYLPHSLNFSHYPFLLTLESLPSNSLFLLSSFLPYFLSPYTLRILRDLTTAFLFLLSFFGNPFISSFLF